MTPKIAYLFQVMVFLYKIRIIIMKLLYLKFIFLVKKLFKINEFSS